MWGQGLACALRCTQQKILLGCLAPGRAQAAARHNEQGTTASNQLGPALWSDESSGDEAGGEHSLQRLAELTARLATPLQNRRATADGVAWAAAAGSNVHGRARALTVDSACSPIVVPAGAPAPLSPPTALSIETTFKAGATLNVRVSTSPQGTPR